MVSRKRFPPELVAALRSGKILGLRAGSAPHRFIGIWVVVVEGRAKSRATTTELVPR